MAEKLEDQAPLVAGTKGGSLSKEEEAVKQHEAMRKLAFATEEFLRKLVSIPGDLITQDAVKQISQFDLLTQEQQAQLTAFAAEGDEFLAQANASLVSLRKQHELFASLLADIRGKYEATALPQKIAEWSGKINQGLLDLEQSMKFGQETPQFLDQVTNKATDDIAKIGPVISEIAELRDKTNNTYFFVPPRTEGQAPSPIESRYGLLWKRIVALEPTRNEIQKNLQASVEAGALNASLTEKIQLRGLVDANVTINKARDREELIRESEAFARELESLVQGKGKFADLLRSEGKFDDVKVKNFKAECQRLMVEPNGDLSLFTKGFDKMLVSEGMADLIRQDKNRIKAVREVNEQIIESMANSFSSIMLEGAKVQAEALLSVTKPPEYFYEEARKIAKKDVEDAPQKAAEEIKKIEAGTDSAEVKQKAIEEVNQGLAKKLARASSEPPHDYYVEKARYELMGQIPKASTKAAECETKLTNFIRQDILSCSSLAERTLAMERYISIAKRLEQANDISTALAIMATIKSAPPLSRLKGTRESLSNQAKADYKKLETSLAVGTVADYSAYFKKAAKSPKTILPPVVVSGLIFRLGEGREVKLDDKGKVINSIAEVLGEGAPGKTKKLEGKSQLSVLMRSVRGVQAVNPPHGNASLIKAVNEVGAGLTQTALDNKQFDLSLQSEPRGQTIEPSRITQQLGSALRPLKREKAAIQVSASAGLSRVATVQAEVDPVSIKEIKVDVATGEERSRPSLKQDQKEVSANRTEVQATAPITSMWRRIQAWFSSIVAAVAPTLQALFGEASRAKTSQATSQQANSLRASALPTMETAKAVSAQPPGATVVEEKNARQEVVIQPRVKHTPPNKPLPPTPSSKLETQPEAKEQPPVDPAPSSAAPTDSQPKVKFDSGGLVQSRIDLYNRLSLKANAAPMSRSNVDAIVNARKKELSGGIVNGPVVTSQPNQEKFYQYKEKANAQREAESTDVTPSTVIGQKGG